jgi:hypothetical protein
MSLPSRSDSLNHPSIMWRRSCAVLAEEDLGPSGGSDLLRRLRIDFPFSDQSTNTGHRMAVDLPRKQPQSASIGPDQTVMVMRRLAAVLGAVDADGVLEVTPPSVVTALQPPANSSRQLKARRAAGPDALLFIYIFSVQGSTTSFLGKQRLISTTFLPTARAVGRPVDLGLSQ